MYFDAVKNIFRALVLRDHAYWHSVGAKLATGNGLPKSERAAVWSYMRGACRGVASCQYDLGFMMILGQGTAPSTTEGLQWLERAAEQDDFSAIRLLHDLYSHGYYGVPVHPDKAEKWRQAAFRIVPGVLLLTFTDIDEKRSAANSTEALEDLTDRIRTVVEESKVGEYSGPFFRTNATAEQEKILARLTQSNEYCVSITGPNPDASLKTVEPILKLFPALRRRCRVTKRYGPNIEGVREETFDLTA